MKYCLDCYHLCENQQCSNCNSRNVRDVLDDDYCFLVEKSALYIETVKEYLEKYNIPYISQGSMGAGMALKVGPMLEMFSIYVPYKYYHDALKIIEFMFKNV